MLPLARRSSPSFSPAPVSSAHNISNNTLVIPASAVNAQNSNVSRSSQPVLTGNSKVNTSLFNYFLIKR